MVGYPGVGFAFTVWLRVQNCRSRGMVLPQVSLGPKPSGFADSLVSVEKWTCASDSHRVAWGCSAVAGLFALRMDEMVPSAGFAPAPRPSQGRVLTDDTTKGMMKWCAMSVMP